VLFLRALRRATGSGLVGALFSFSSGAAVQRLLSLDVVRAIAVILVLLCHSGYIPDHPSILEPFARGGGSGVDIFFVLSGFLISGLLFKNPDWKRFLIRRAWKIYPSFWLLIAVTVLPQLRTIDWGHVANELLFIQNYRTGLWSHTWSLAIEEHFYLALPFFMLALRRTNYRLLPFAAIAAMVLCIELRCCELPLVGDLTNQLDMHDHLMKTHLRFDELLLGVALQYWFAREAIVRFCNRHSVLFAASGIAMLLPTFVIGAAGPHIVWLTTFKAIGSACLVAAFVARGVPESRFTRGLGFIGKYSYSIYLFHPIPLLWLADTGWTAVVMYLAASLIAGIHLGRCIELPVLTLRDRMALSMAEELALDRTSGSSPCRRSF
jgi:peptidoglycan/LPS O-acetylase OafA/YrhL